MKFLFVDLWPWWLAGIIIGLLVPLMYYFFNTALGVSTGYGNLLKIAFPKIKLKWLNTDTFKNKSNWRFLFIIGMIIGGFISARVSGMPFINTGMGLFTQKLNWSYVIYIIWFFVGGALLGFGARLANGCTSGHCIHGLATLQKSSLAATVFFLLFGVIGTFFVKLLVLAGA
ncbi:MAG: YeeE/YedE family protein [Clostridiales bacterium]|nr:YeeE/YedE family protein [Clostridiales bacterium]